MAEPLGIAASIITIHDLVVGVKHFVDKCKNAPDDLQRYYDRLEGLDHIQHVLDDIIKNTSDDKIRPKIELEDGTRRDLVDFCNEVLKKVREEATSALQKFDSLGKDRSLNTLGRIFTKLRTSIRFVRENEHHLPDLIQAVDYAKSSLQSAICVVQLFTSDSHHRQIQLSFDDIKNHMATQSKQLEKLHESIQERVNSIQYPPVSQSPLPDPESKLGSTKAPVVNWDSGAKPFTLSMEPRDTSQSQHEDPKPSTDITYRGGSLDGRPVEGMPIEPLSGAKSDNVSRGKMPTETIADHGVPISATRNDQDALESKMTLYSMTLGTTDQSSTTKNDEHRRLPQSDLDDLTDVHAPVRSMMTSSNVEFDSYLPLVEVELEYPTEALIPETLRLEECLSSEVGLFLFCVNRLALVNSSQTWFLQEPCSSQKGCMHIKVEAECWKLTRVQLPCKISSLSIGYDQPHAPESITRPDKASNTCVLTLFQHYHYPHCVHTIVEIGTRSEAKCAFPAILHAKFGEIDLNALTMDIIRAEVPEIVKDRGNSAAPRESSDGPPGIGWSLTRDESPDNQPEIPRQPLPEDDQFAFSILRNVMLGRAAHVPEIVDLDTLLSFMQLADKYNLGDLPLRHARIWVQFHRERIPDSLTNEAIAWLWVLWKLEMAPEFKALSGVVQQQVRQPLDQVENNHQVSLPRHIIDGIEERRLSVLKRVKALMDSHIDSSRIIYLETFQGFHSTIGSSFPPDSTVSITSSLVFGYLTLERERWLLWNDRATDSGQVFEGLGFSDICRFVRSMRDPEEWEVRVAPALLFRMVKAVLPTIGAIADREIVRVSSTVKGDLLRLILRLEEEDWGLTLA